MAEPTFAFLGTDAEGRPKWLVFPCQRPGQPGEQCQIALRPSQHNAVGASWAWDGNRDAPTITPSIDCSRVCGWHGWLTAGQFRTA